MTAGGSGTATVTAPVLRFQADARSGSPQIAKLIGYVTISLSDRDQEQAMGRVYLILVLVGCVVLLLTYVGVWVVGAGALWLVVRSLGPLPLDAFPLVLGAWGLAFLAGFAVPFLPSGLGVREGVLAVVLGPVVGPEVAIASALLFRVVLTLAEALCLLVCIPQVGAIIERP